MTTKSLFLLALTTATLAVPARLAAYQRTSVHDPSVVVDTITDPAKQTFYIFGSHMGVSRSTDLINWQSNITGGENTSATLWGRINAEGKTVACSYNDAFTTHTVTRVQALVGGEVKEVDFGNYDAKAWQTYLGNTIRGMMWAPDVIWNPTMQKWLLYMGINGDDWQSVIVCMAADRIEGPYVYQGPVVYSGFGVEGRTLGYKQTDLELVLGELSELPARYQHGLNTSDNWGRSWGDYWPNNIDPCVFYDDDGNLKLAYGSWSGGIFLLDLDETNGLRDYTVTYPVEASGTYGKDITSDPYFGRHLAGGWYVSGEGPYIRKIGQWWYLFMSYGGYAPDGGYEMRVFRAAKADGPYVDCSTTTGRPALYTGAWVVNYGKDETDHRGMKLMGAYRWPSMLKPEIAQGHNSAMTDREGRSFVVYHTKFVDGTAGHEVRVHQLFQNEDGWLVAAPYEFKGETTTQRDVETQQKFTAADVAGTYSMLRHTYRQDNTTMAYNTPTQLTLQTDGTLTGSAVTSSGSWQLVEGTSFIRILLNGVTYKGVLTEQTVDNTSRQTLTFSVVSSSAGTAGATRALQMWGSKLTDDEIGKTTLGLEDNSVAAFVAYSEPYVIRPQQTLHLEFTNYTSRQEAYHNWLLFLSNDANRGTSGYTEHFALRADWWAWQGTKNRTDPSWYEEFSLEGYDWDTFKADMDGAQVVMDIIRDGAKVTTRATMTSTAGKTFSETLVLNVGDGKQNLRACLSVEKAHLVVDDTKTTLTTTTGIEEKACDAARQPRAAYDLQGRRADNADRRGLFIIDGRKVFRP